MVRTGQGFWRGAVTAAAVVVSACAHDPFERMVADPWASHGRVFEFVVYPVEFAPGEGRSYAMCFEPCPPPWRHEPAAVIRPLVPGAFAGMHGTEAVAVKVRLDASCFAPDAFVCPHFPFHFDQTR
jgi:hypothetical protein